MRRLIFFLLLSQISFAATYFVKNGGSDVAAGTSDGAAWATISKVNGFTFSAGDTIQFKCGSTWNEATDAALIIPASSLTFTSYGVCGTLPILDGQGTVAQGVTVSGKSNVVIDSLNIKRSSSYNVLFASCATCSLTNNILKDAAIHSVNVTSASPTFTATGNSYSTSAAFDMSGKAFNIASTSASVSTITGNTIDLSLVLSTRNTSGIVCSASTVGCDIEQNTIILAQALQGIGQKSVSASGNVSGGKIIGNSITGITNSCTGCDGEGIELTGDVTHQVTNEIVSGNYCKLGASAADCLGLFFATNNTVSYNFFIGNSGTNAGMHPSSSSNNNVFYGNDMYLPGANYGFEVTGTSITNDFVNNIIVGSNYGIIFASGGAGTFSYNIAFSNATANFSGGTNNGNNVLNDPKWASATPASSSDFALLTTSPALLAGNNLGSTYQAANLNTGTFPYSTVNQGSTWTIGAFISPGLTYTVKATGGDFTTLSGCAAVAITGNTCIAYASASPQSGWTEANSGLAGNPITFTVNPGDSVTVTSTVTLSGRSYINLQNLAFSATTNAINGNSSTQHCLIDSNTFIGTRVFYIPDGAGSGGSNNVFSNNVISRSATVTTSSAVYVYGDSNRFENNEIGGGTSDAFNLGGSFDVVRGNYFHDVNGTTSGEHVDFVQGLGSTLPALAFSLIELNVEKNCISQCHFVQLRGGGGAIDDTVITRENYAYNLDSLFAGYGDHNDGVATVINGFVYNNTAATEAVRAENGDGAGFDSGFGTAINNIFFNVEAGSFSPTIFTQGGLGNGNITFTTAYASTWNSPYSTETTYLTLRNQNPNFVSYPADGTLNVGSPAIQAGVSLTAAVGAGVSSTALTVGSAHAFQPGWAGTTGDWIRIGAATTRQISSINYSTNVITLASSATWSNADPIYLFKNSSGTQVLNGVNPDVGAFPFVPSSTPVIARRR